MSYDIVKSIKHKPDGVYITSACSNLHPRTYGEWKSQRISAMPTKEAREIAILEEYESGNLQGGSNKYTKALAILRGLPEYKPFDWRNGNWEESKVNRARNEAELHRIMLGALKATRVKPSFLVQGLLCPRTGKLLFAKYRKGARSTRWTTEPSKASKFYSQEEADNFRKMFIDGERWKTINL